MPKYQGKEIQSTLQAPTASSLQEMVDSAKEYAEENNLGELEVLEFSKDPDGGYRAIVTAHNWNPISWLKGKLTRKKGPEEEEGEVVSIETGGEDPEEVKREEKRAWEAYMKQSKREEAVSKIRSEYRTKRATRLRELEDIGKEEAIEGQIQEKVKDLPRGHRRAAAKGLREAWRERQQADIEITSEGIPEKIITKQKVLQKEYWTDKETGQPVPEPRTAEERARADYHPSQWTFVDVERKLSPAERSSLARAVQFEEMELGVAKEKYKQFKREQHPAYKVAKAAGGFGQFMAGAVTMGAAGMARGARPGRGGPERAMRMHAPGVPMDLYAVRPVLGVGMPTGRDLTGAGLGHLRELTLPGIRRTRSQVRRVRRDVEQGER